MPEPSFFATSEEFRAWLEAHHEDRTELTVGFHRAASGLPSITWREAVDEALCFGWIDGVRHKLNETSYTNRFTPRKARSTWSKVNIDRVEQLTRQGRMTPAGLAAFERRKEANIGTYSYEQRHLAAFDRAAERRFRANRKAWSFFQAQPAGYRRTTTWWVVSAKRQETRDRRLDRLIADSAAGRRIQPLA